MLSESTSPSPFNPSPPSSPELPYHSLPPEEGVNEKAASCFSKCLKRYPLVEGTGANRRWTQLGSCAATCAIGICLLGITMGAGVLIALKVANKF